MRGWMVGMAVLGLALRTAALSSDELTRHLDARRRQLEDASRPIAERERVTLEMVDTLDRAALAAQTASERQERWSEASILLEEFLEDNPRHPRADEFVLQSAVYHWARGRTWFRQAEISPNDQEAKARAVEQFDAAVSMLRSVVAAHAHDRGQFAQNARFRLAQALADRSRTEPDRSNARQRIENEALGVLETPTTDLGLRGFADLLRADLLARLGRFGEAQTALDEAGHAQPPPTAAELREVQVGILLGRHRPDKAWAIIEAVSKKDRATDLLAVRVRLEQRTETPAGPRRSELEADLFRRADALRRSNGPEGRLALLILAEAVSEPDESQDPKAWDTLAEGQLLAGNADQASRLALRGAERASELGQLDQANSLRYRAGGILFQAEKFAKVAEVLTPIVENSEIGMIRPKASLLRALALGRVVTTSQAQSNRTAYRRALEIHLATFPDDPTSAEARWLLGRVRLEAGQREQAVALWSDIPPSASRWIEARLALASLLRRDVETQSLNGDQSQIRVKVQLALTFLSDAITQTRDLAGQDELRLERIALQLLPMVAQPEEARQTTERLVREASRDDQRRRARQLRIVALVELGRYLEAERELAEAVDGGASSECLTLARWFDQIATASDSDLARRRAGQLLRDLISRMFGDSSELGPVEVVEVGLRQVRALLFSGDPDAAKRAIERWPALPSTISVDLLHDLADTYERLDVQALAIDAYRLWMKRSQAGTPPWFAARYGLALAYERSGQLREARQLVEATAILHPDLGGGLLRDRFERLRKRLK